MAVRRSRATLRDVARESGYSVSTVSRAFSNPEMLSPHTVQHIKEVSARLRFVPNALAKALITRTAPNIGLVVPDIANPFMTTILKAAQARSRLRDVGLVVADTDDSAEEERRVSEQFARQTRGLLLCAPRMSASHIREIAETVPLVLINRTVKGIPSVHTDSGPALRELVDELVGLGHRRLGYLAGPSGSWADRQRLRAVADQARRHGLDVARLGPTSARLADGIEAATAVADSGATAVLAFDDVLASGLVEGLHRRGLSVPGDISVIGHDDVLAELTRPNLTTIDAQSARVGRLAVDRLLDDDHPGAPGGGDALAVPALVVRRASVAAAAS